MDEPKFLKEQIRTWRRLGELLRQGKPLVEALEAHIQEIEEGEWKGLLVGVRGGLKKGEDLSTVLGNHLDVFTDYTVYQLGRAEGRGAQALQDAVDKVTRALRIEDLKEKHLSDVFEQLEASKVLDEIQKLKALPAALQASLADAGMKLGAAAQGEPGDRRERGASVAEALEQVLARLSGDVTAKASAEALKGLLQKARAAGATDVHLEPREGDVRVRLRVEGELRDGGGIDLRTGKAVVARLKAMAGLDPSVTSIPQEGRAETDAGEVRLELRVATAPHPLGEKAVLRVRELQVEAPRLDAVGLDRADVEEVRRWLGRRRGLVIVSGPMGSGRTTTSRAVLADLDPEKSSLVAVEESRYTPLRQVHRIPIDPGGQLTWARAARAAAALDPDALLLGDLPDAETVLAAIDIAAHGPLVVAEITARSASAALARIRDLGATADQLRAVLLGVLSQRLHRRLDPERRESYDATPDEARRAGLERPLTLWRARPGEGSGFRGQVAVFELLRPAPDLFVEYAKGAPEAAMEAAAVAGGMATLRKRAVERARQGVTTLDEALRAIEG